MTFRTPIIAGNWKLNLSSKQGADLASAVLEGTSQPRCEVILFPTFLAVGEVAKVVRGSDIQVGVQNIYWEEWGAYTGEISPQAVLAEGISWTLVGHSERRKYFSESDALLARKAYAAISTGLKVIFCVGETLDERDSGCTFEVLARQLKDGVLAACPRLHKNLVIAYEPVWAIGTGKTASPQTAQESHLFIRNFLAEEAGTEAAEKIRILYGGSVKSGNIGELMNQPDIDGGLVGGASLNAEEFLNIIRHKE